MSAPDPKAWALTEADWERMVDTYGYWKSEIPDVIQSVARRRALEELRALLPSCNAAQIHDRIAAIEAEEV